MKTTHKQRMALVEKASLARQECLLEQKKAYALLDCYMSPLRYRSNRAFTAANNTALSANDLVALTALRDAGFGF